MFTCGILNRKYSFQGSKLAVSEDWLMFRHEQCCKITSFETIRKKKRYIVVERQNIRVFSCDCQVGRSSFTGLIHLPKTLILWYKNGLPIYSNALSYALQTHIFLVHFPFCLLKFNPVLQICFCNSFSTTICALKQTNFLPKAEHIHDLPRRNSPDPL